MLARELPQPGAVFLLPQRSPFAQADTGQQEYKRTGTMYWRKKSSRGPQTHVFCWTPTPEPHHQPPPMQARGWGLVGPLLFPTLTRPGLESSRTAGPQPAHAPAGLLEFSLHAAGWLGLREPTARHLGAGIRCSRLYTELIHLVT